MTERELAKQVIKELETSPFHPGICSALGDITNSSNLSTKLPKLYKHLSQRRNYYYNVFDRFLGRKKGYYSMYYLWKPYNHKPRIAILKKIYNIK